MATHSSILAWRIPWTEEPGGLQSMGSQESDMTQGLNQPPPRELKLFRVLNHFFKGIISLETKQLRLILQGDGDTGVNTTGVNTMEVDATLLLQMAGAHNLGSMQGISAPQKTLWRRRQSSRKCRGSSSSDLRRMFQRKISERRREGVPQQCFRTTPSVCEVSTSPFHLYPSHQPSSFFH